MVDAAVGDRVEDRLARRSVAPVAPLDQQPALGVRVKATRLVQQLAPGHPGEPLSGEDQGDLVAGGRKLLETGERLLRRPHADDAVVPRVAVAQLPLDVPQGVRILVNGDKHGARHALHVRGALPREVNKNQWPRYERPWLVAAADSSLATTQSTDCHRLLAVPPGRSSSTSRPEALPRPGTSTGSRDVLQRCKRRASGSDIVARELAGQSGWAARGGRRRGCSRRSGSPPAATSPTKGVRLPDVPRGEYLARGHRAGDRRRRRVPTSSAGRGTAGTSSLRTWA